MIRLLLPSADDGAEIVEALLTAAATREASAPGQAARWRDLAHALGDALDTLPEPTTTED